MGVRDGLETCLPEVGPLGGYHSLEGGPVAMGLEEAEMPSVPKPCLFLAARILHVE